MQGKWTPSFQRLVFAHTVFRMIHQQRYCVSHQRNQWNSRFQNWICDTALRNMCAYFAASPCRVVQEGNPFPNQNQSMGIHGYYLDLAQELSAKSQPKWSIKCSWWSQKFTQIPQQKLGEIHRNPPISGGSALWWLVGWWWTLPGPRQLGLR